MKTEVSTWIRQARMAAETREFESEFARLRKQIEKTEPWPYSRFTDALEAGLNCMPRGATYEAMHAIAKRKVSMAKDILSDEHSLISCLCCNQTFSCLMPADRI